MQISKSSQFSQWAARFSRWLDRGEVSGRLVLSATAVVVGVGTAFGAIAFIELLAQVSALRDGLRSLIGSAAGLVVAMMLAGFTVGRR